MTLNTANDPVQFFIILMIAAQLDHSSKYACVAFMGYHMYCCSDNYREHFEFISVQTLVVA